MAKQANQSPISAQNDENKPDPNLIYVNKEEYDRTISEARGAKGKLTQLSARLYDLQEELNALKQNRPREESPSPLPAPVLPAAHVESQAAPAPASSPVHIWSPTMKSCPTCGDNNPEFKDESQCVNCKVSLGSKATLPKVHACPGCGKSDVSTAPNYDPAWKAVLKNA